MEGMNPVDWFSYLYGKFFLGHARIGGAVVVGVSTIVIAFVVLLLWVRGVDKYNDEHPKVRTVAEPEKPPTVATKPTPAPTPNLARLPASKKSHSDRIPKQSADKSGPEPSFADVTPPIVTLRGESCDAQVIESTARRLWMDRRHFHPSDDPNKTACEIDADLAAKGWNCKITAAWATMPVAKVGIYLGPDSKRNTFENTQAVGTEKGLQVEGTDNNFRNTTTAAAMQQAACAPQPQ